MKFLLWILLLFALAVGLTQVSHNSAYFLLVYPPYRIEFSLVLFIVFMGLTFILGYVVVRLFSTVVRLPETVRSFRAERAKIKGHKLLQEATTLFFEGRYAAAERAAVRGMKLDDAYDLYAVIAARAAHELRDYDKRDAYLSVEGRQPSEVTMRVITASEFMLAQHNPQGALETLQQLPTVDAKADSARLLLEMKAQQQLGNWDAVLKLLKPLEKKSAIDTTVALETRLQAWLGKIHQQEDVSGIQACLDDMPTDVKRDSQICMAAARALIKQGAGSLAQHLLEGNLKRHWDSELVLLYGDCDSDNSLQQIEQAEKWLNEHPQDASLLLTLGKLCMQQQLWGKAKNYLDASISVKPTREAWMALGKMADQLGQNTEATEYFRQATEVNKDD